MSEKKETANVMPIPSEKSFALSKVKTLKDGGLDVHYEVTETIGNESYTNKYHVESAKDIHPDLRECFDRLRPIMGRIFNITSFLSLMDTPDMKGNQKQKDAARNFADEMLEKIICDIENEVYAFLFKGKKAQLELFGADGEPAPGMVAEPEKEDGLFPEVGDPANEDDTEDETADM